MSVTELASVADDFELPPPKRRGTPCSVGTVLAGGLPPGSTGEPLTEGNRRRLAGMLADPAALGTQIGQLLRERRGLAVPDGSVNRHRAGRCRCER